MQMLVFCGGLERSRGRFNAAAIVQVCAVEWRFE